MRDYTQNPFFIKQVPFRETYVGIRATINHPAQRQKKYINSYKSSVKLKAIPLIIIFLSGGAPENFNYFYQFSHQQVSEPVVCIKCEIN